MTVVVDGASLTLDEVVRVARAREPVVLAPDVGARMTAARAIAERAVEDGAPAYGITTGVGVRKSFEVADDAHDRLLVRHHLIAQGEPLAPDVVRAATLRLVNALAQGTTSARPVVAERLVAALAADALPSIPRLGSAGLGDLAQTAQLVEGALSDLPLARGEAIALLNQNAFSTGHAALALHDALALLETVEVAAALDLAAFGADHAALLHPAIGRVRPSPGVMRSLDRLRSLLDGLPSEGRALQDPLTFRTLPQLHGAARDALGFVLDQVAMELNTHQSNPLVVVEEERIVSVGDFETVGLAMALDLARLAVAQLLTAGAERWLKLLQAPLTGLTEGLAERPGLAESALSELAFPLQSLTAEARLLAQPVSLELVSTTQAEGIEDRLTMTPLAARRLAEQVGLGVRIVSIGLVLGAQACDLREVRLTSGAGRAHALVRTLVPFMREGQSLPAVETLLGPVTSGEFGRL